MEEVLQKYNLGAYIDITNDEHFNEYLSESDQRIKHLTGFTGSNGISITCKRNILFTDARYYIQAKKELKNYEMGKMDADLYKNIGNHIKYNIDIKRVGLNPKYFSFNMIEKLQKELTSDEIELVFITDDISEIAYKDLPRRKFNEIYSIEEYKLHDFYRKNFALLNPDVDYKSYMLNKDLKDNCGIVHLTYQEKMKLVKGKLKDNEELIISECDTICWLFNLRGSDIMYNSVFYSYATVSRSSVKLFCKGNIYLEGVEICDYYEFDTYINSKKNSKMVISSVCNQYIWSILENKTTTEIVRDLQSIKYKEELEGFHLAYILDGIALIKLFSYIEENKGNLTEMDVANKLLDLKSKYYGFKFPSFESIVGVGENSAIIHYSANKKEILDNNILLLDIGSNYVFGTTDTSRTLYLGNPPDDVRCYYTKVLKGQLRAMSQKYPYKVPASIIDSLTRLDLWNNKEDYAHAAGHGVGHFLCVHECPPTITLRSSEPVLLNQVFSIEPGIYFENKFGIRLENLVYSKDIGEGFMKLVNITYVPYQLNMINHEELEISELNYFNEQSKLIRKTLEQLITDKKCKKYLLLNTTNLRNK